MEQVATPPVALDGLFTDHCVVQRDKPIRIFGVAPGLAKVRVTFDRDTRTVPVKDGRFLAIFPKRRKATGLTIGLEGKTVATDVAIGEVWIASGQSNMEWPVAASDDLDRAKREADPRVRMITIVKRAEITPVRSVDAKWVVASADTVGGFSGVANSFAHHLAKKLDVPVGIVHSSWGGTPAESWISRSALESAKTARPLLERMDAEMKDFPAAKAEYDRKKAIYDAERAVLDTPAPATPPVMNGWRKATLPASLETLEGKAVDGAFWVRKTVVLSADMAAAATTLRLGAIDDFDTVYVNGKRVAGTGKETPEWWSVSRKYALPAGTFRAGPNEIAVRVVDTQQGGGFTSSPSDLAIDTVVGLVPLAGEWEYRAEGLLTGEAPPAPMGPGNPWLPTSLSSGMIAPIEDLNIGGAIWYQGESNAGRAAQYKELMTALVTDWRERFRDKELPFIQTLLANFMPRKAEPSESGWAELREAQDHVYRTIPQFGQVSAMDIGDADDIHPRNKREVGRRMAILAASFFFDLKDEEAESPWAFRVRPFGSTAIVDFVSAKVLKTTDGARPKGFAVRSKDGPWVWAEARIVGRTVELTHPKGEVIDAVRYGWADNPELNLTNGAGLPAFPFRAEGELGNLKIG